LRRLENPSTTFHGPAHAHGMGSQERPHSAAMPRWTASSNDSTGRQRPCICRQRGQRVAPCDATSIKFPARASASVVVSCVSYMLPWCVLLFLAEHQNRPPLPARNVSRASFRKLPIPLVREISPFSAFAHCLASLHPGPSTVAREPFSLIQASGVSLEYLLLSPRSAPTHVPARVTPSLLSIFFM